MKNTPRTLGVKIKIKLSSTHHPQSNGQIEKINQVLKQNLHCTITYYQDNWTELLPLARFAYNNTIKESSQQTSFLANYRYHLQSDQFNNKVENWATGDLAIQLSEILTEMKDKLPKAQDQQNIIHKSLRKRILWSTLGIRYGYFVVISRPIIHVINLTSVILDPSWLLSKSIM